MLPAEGRVEPLALYHITGTWYHVVASGQELGICLCHSVLLWRTYLRSLIAKLSLQTVKYHLSLSLISISVVHKTNHKTLTSLIPVFLMSGTRSRASLESYEEKAVSDSASVSTNDRGTEPIQRTPTSRTAVDHPDGAPLESAISYQSVPAQPSIPDGGTVAWLQVLAGFFMFFNSWYALAVTSLETFY